METYVDEDNIHHIHLTHQQQKLQMNPWSIESFDNLKNLWPKKEKDEGIVTRI